ncbi:hypothetical protein A3J17_05165 [Candidatus Curtissbacteria bacterium RIFCSPLOWO2_02_FULL_40_11]|nr:MAG: hypothetical protein A3J17_05165 [Candidatus Curtissbacteria bacterium RIFCSPLOWO2_02_FULL_40_11]
MSKTLLFNNTYKSGRVTFLVIQEDKKYTGVCLEFDLSVQAETPEEARRLIEDYTKVWHRNAVKNKLPEEVLNRPAPKKYWEIYKKLLEFDLSRLLPTKQKPVVSKAEPQQVASYQFPYPLWLLHNELATS